MLLLNVALSFFCKYLHLYSLDSISSTSQMFVSEGHLSLKQITAKLQIVATHMQIWGQTIETGECIDSFTFGVRLIPSSL